MSEERKTYFVDVILPLSLPQSYTYRVPQELSTDIEIGKRVIVQFGKKRIYSAIIVTISEKPPQGYEAKYILSVLDESPLVTHKQLDFWQWMANYYVSNMGEVMNAALPAGLKLESQTIVIINPEHEEIQAELSDDEETIYRLIAANTELAIDKLIEQTHGINTLKHLKVLQNKGLVFVKEDLSSGYKPKFEKCLILAEEYEKEDKLREVFDKLEKRGTKQLEVLMYFMSIWKKGEEVRKTEISHKKDLSTAALNTLITKGILKEYTVEVDRLNYKEVKEVGNLLNKQQKKAYTEIKKVFEEKDVALLHGITSSGKTHIYIELIKEQLEESKQVLYLVPEIALTFQLIQRLQQHFGKEVVVYHSKFSTNERVEVWNKVADNEVKIIIGPRSAVFLPFHELGLVIIDEEHESSFKQFDPAPRYHGRDSAIYLAYMWGVKTLLGTATPSMESYYNTQQGKYGLVELTNRHGDVNLPDMVVANVADEMRMKQMQSVFTSQLLGEIKDTLAKDEQVILFQNRKGYVPVTECSSCGYTPKCVNCDITLTYYKYQNNLRCHYCGYKQAPIEECPACGSTEIQMQGYGTERIEEDLGFLLPEAKISRFDYDTTRTKTAHEKIITAFANKESNVLVGTQMVTKGLDFDSVALVGIISADQLLNFPDFRAHERSFQLMEQIAGRAGRREKTGHVIIQTYQPQHDIIKAVLKHDYKEFYDKEIVEREKYNYPPFKRLISITIKNKDFYVLNDASNYLAMELATLFGDNLLGPETPHISKIRNYHLKTMLIKLDSKPGFIKNAKLRIADILHKLKLNKDYKGTFTAIDVDPY